MKRLLALIPAGLLALASFLPAYAAPATSDPLLLAPSFIDKSFGQNVAISTASTTAWTYTVPNGRDFRMEAITAYVLQGIFNCSATVTAGSNEFLANANSSATNGESTFVPSGTVGLVYYPAGTVFTATYANSGTTGACQTYIYMHGTEFNAP